MLRTGGGDRQYFMRSGNTRNVMLGGAATTYPAMVESVKFQEQYLERGYAREKRELGFYNATPRWQARIRCLSLQPQYVVT